MKALGLVVSDKKIFEKLQFENLLFDPVTYLCNQSEPFEIFWWGDHQGTIPIEFCQITISGSREDVV